MQNGPNMNPYAPPTRHAQGGTPASPSEAVQMGVCPKCGSNNVHKPSFTWWGGVIGPKMFNHTVCRSCGFGYNGTTGESNQGKIIAYFVIINVVVIVALIALYGSR